MEIKKGTLVVIVSGFWASNYCIGLVVSCSESGKDCKLELRNCFADCCKTEDLVPIAENCTTDNLKEILAIPKMPEIIKNLVADISVLKSVTC